MSEINGIKGLQGTFAYNPYPYYDIEDVDPTYSTYPMYGGFGMDGSIFGAMPMFGMGYGVGSQNYFNNMKDYQKFYIDYNVDQQKMQRNADLRINASMEAIQNTFNALKDKINSNEQGQIEEAYANFVSAVANAYGSNDKKEVKARASTIYTQLNGGKTIVQDLREKAHGSYLQGVLHALTFGLYDSKSAEDNISHITGAPVATGDKTSQNLGRLTGIGLIGVGAAALASKFKSGKAIIIGAIAAGVAAAATFFTGKVST